MTAWLTKSESNARTVLIVSDQKESTEMIENLFKQKNCSVLVEINAINAVQTARIVAPAVVILDLNLIRSDWTALIIELTRVTRAQILCVIPKANTWDIFALYEAGATECLLRPVSPLLLLMKTTALLFRHEWMTDTSIGSEAALA